MDLQEWGQKYVLEKETFNPVRIVCSCAVKLADESRPNSASSGAKYSAFVNSISPHGTCLEMELAIEKGFLLNLLLSPVGGPPVQANARVLSSRPSLRKGFHMIVAKFEEMSETDQQNLLSLLATISHMQKENVE